MGRGRGGKEENERDGMRCNAMRYDAMRCDAMRCDAMGGTINLATCFPGQAQLSPRNGTKSTTGYFL